MIRPSSGQFIPENIEYCQLFNNFINTLHPHRIKFFDETRSTLCWSNAKCPNTKCNSKCTLRTSGIRYANTFNGASDTVEFLNFFFEASQTTQPNGSPVLQYSDFIVLDNAAIHRFEGGRVSAKWLESFLGYISLPVYSPELSPVQTVSHRYEFRNILQFV